MHVLSCHHGFSLVIVSPALYILSNFQSWVFCCCLLSKMRLYAYPWIHSVWHSMLIAYSVICSWNWAKHFPFSFVFPYMIFCHLTYMRRLVSMFDVVYCYIWVMNITTTIACFFFQSTHSWLIGSLRIHNPTIFVHCPSDALLAQIWDYTAAAILMFLLFVQNYHRSWQLENFIEKISNYCPLVIKISQTCGFLQLLITPKKVLFMPGNSSKYRMLPSTWNKA